MDDLLAHTEGYNLGTGCMSSGFVNPEIIAVPLAVPWRIHIGTVRKSSRILLEELLRFTAYLTEAVREVAP